MENIFDLERYPIADSDHPLTVDLINKTKEELESIGCAVIPGATSATHIRENLHLRRVRLSEEEEAQLAGARRPDTWRLWRNMKCAPGDRGGCAREESK